jgi:hypothetical protein
MRRNQALISSFIGLTTFALLLPRAHAGDSCQPMMNSVTKRLSTSSHMYMTETGGYLKGETRNGEMIYAGENTYINVKGQWRKSPVSKQEMLEQQQENWKNAKSTTCHVVGDEAVGGQMATIYSVHSETEDSKEDGRIWLSKSSGLPLKEEIDIDVGGGAMGKSHKSIRYEYNNVHAPI